MDSSTDEFQSWFHEEEMRSLDAIHDPWDSDEDNGQSQ